MSSPATTTPPKTPVKKSNKPLWWAIGCIIAIIICGRLWRGGNLWPKISQISEQNNQYSSVTLTKYSWAEVVTTGKNFRGVSLNPPVRRLVMVDDDPNRIYPLPAGIDNSIDLGISRSLKFKIDPSEEPTFSKFEYELR